MSERRDYVALEWVAGEIEETLRLAAHVLEEYRETPSDITKLRFCLTHIHQVQGTLKMVEFFGAALLAEEMEGVTNALIQGKIHDSHTEDALLVLAHSIAQLPLYLERVKESRHGLPATLLPVLNDLRAVRGESLLSETVLFSPELESFDSSSSDLVEVAITGDELQEIAHKLRQMFQIALLGLIRSQELKKNLNYLAKVCARLVKLSQGCYSQPLWKVCIALLEGLLNGSIEPSISVKILLRQVDRELKFIVEKGESAIRKRPKEGLLKNLLYYIARSKADSKYISEIKTQYKLDRSLPGVGELDDESLALPDSQLMQSMVEALGRELEDIKLALAQAGDSHSQLSDVLPLFKRVCDTMAVLGMGNVLKIVQEPFSQLSKILLAEEEVSRTDLNVLNEQILLAERALNSYDLVERQTEEEKPFNDSEEAQDHLNKALDSIIRESRKNLEAAKEAVIEFVATQWDHNSLVEMPSLLNSVYGSLKMAPFERAASIVNSCNMFVTKELLENKTVPAWQKLDTLADAITSIEYYLERIADGVDSESEAILEVASESVAELGYPVELVQELSPSFEQAETGLGESSSSVADSSFLTEQNSTDDEFAASVATNDQLSVGDVDEEATGTKGTEINSNFLTDQSAAEKSVAAENEEEVDPEIIEIFVEEAGEVLEAIAESLPTWKLNQSDTDSQSTVRRAFHTLKGSGRMVGAEDIGDLSWSIENMLNRISDGSTEVDQVRFDLIDKVVSKIPEFVGAFENKQRVDRTLIEHFINCAEALAAEQTPDIELEHSGGFAGDSRDEENLSGSVEGTDVSVEPATDSLELKLDEELDAELMEIFAAETIAHAQVLKSFIDHCRDLSGPAVLTDELQRALHTLKGSANMAGIIPVAQIVIPIEHMIKEFRASQLKTNEETVELLAEGLGLIQAGITQLAVTPLQSLPQSDEFIQRTQELTIKRIASVLIDGDSENGIPPEAITQFLGDSLDRITEVANELARWEKDGAAGADLTGFESKIDDFVDHAASINLLIPAEFGQALEVLYRRGIEASSVDGAFFSLAGSGNDALIDMLDQIAGNQEPVFDQKLFDQIQNFEFIEASSSLTGYIESAELEIGNVRDLDESRDVITESLVTALNGGSEAAYQELLDNSDQDQQDTVDITKVLVDDIDSTSEELHSSEPDVEQELESEPVAETRTTLSSKSIEELDIITLMTEFVEVISKEPKEIEAGDLSEFLGNVLDSEAVNEVFEEQESSFLTDSDETDDNRDQVFEPERVSVVDDNQESIAGVDSGHQLDVGDINESDIAGYLDAITDFSVAETENSSDDFASLLESSIEENPIEENIVEVSVDDSSGEENIQTVGHKPDYSLDEEQKYPALKSEFATEQTNVEEISNEDSSSEDSPRESSAEEIVSESREVDEDSDMEAEIIEIFLEEADDLLEDIDGAIHKWEQNRVGRGPLNDLLRILHTMKGGARLAGLVAVGNLSHNFETSLITADNENIPITDAFIADVQQYQDYLISQISEVKSGGTAKIAIDIVLGADKEMAVVEEQGDLTAVLSSQSNEGIAENEGVETNTEEETLAEAGQNEEPVFNEQVDEPVVEPLQTQDYVTDKGTPDSTFDSIPDTDSENQIRTLDRPAEMKDPAVANRLQEMVKVPAQLLEELVNLAGETSISRGRAEEQMSELVFSLDEMQMTVDRLQEQVRRLDMETEQQILYRQEQVESEGLEGFDPLEMDRYSHLQQLSRSLLESSSDLIDIKSTLSDKSRDMETLLIQQSRINTDLQEGLLRSRMVPFQRMVPRLRRIVRQVSNELGKNVELRSDNIEGELDRVVLERMVAPLEHMIRNAVDHGIESVEKRRSIGKPDKGIITLNLLREGGEIVLQLSDDGAGIDIEAVKEKAIERDLMDEDAKLTEREILQFIMQPGFSTAVSVTQISGRGVGMDVAHSEIKQLGGSMEIESTLTEGTTFTIRLPFTVSVNRALMVSIAGDNYAIPLNTIEGIVRVSPFELETYYQPDAPLFEYAGQPYVLRYMGSLLQRGERPNLEGQSMPLPVLLVRGVDHSVAVQVDSLMGSREIVVKPLGPQFSRVQGLSGATVLGDGSVVVILDLMAMIRADVSHLHRDRRSITKQSSDEKKNILVMVVDDSVTVRKVMSRFIERQGMDVLLAQDGVDAIAQLNEIDQVPDLMLLDIEMPRMDGFEVANRVRHNGRLKDIPIIMITSRTGEKHRDRALSLGVNEYIGKPYQEAELLEKIISLTGVQVE